ncbi:sensor histidine kinase [Roseateles sp. BYS87W]|uniref:Sensor histidine kinase n=1 Tax=Pelomonas baiyunensis TaxID=3299026 RepID=A0ABW7H1N1_9BURK
MASLLDRLHWRQWFYPGPKRVFSPEEMSRAGQQPWPVAVDSYVAINLVALLPAMAYTRHGRAWLDQAGWWLVWCGLAAFALLGARLLWRQPTRQRLNQYCYGAMFVLGLVLGLMVKLKLVPVAWVLDKQAGLIAGMTGVLSAWWMVTIFRVQQIEGRLRELADQDAALRLSTRLAAAQIQPHFLFNTLASLQHWVDTGDARAAPLLREFTAYLRATLPMFEREMQSLSDELAMVQRYLAIMQARLGARLTFHIDAPADVDPLLPPGLVLTLVENAIEHGIEPQLRGGQVTVTARRDGEHAVITVGDDGPGLAPGWTDGVGLSNTRRRLRAALPLATLTLTDTAPGCRATLTV